MKNLRNLRKDFGAYGPGGFYDAINVSTGEMSERYLSLDQGMIMAALGNQLAERRDAVGVHRRRHGRPGCAADAHGGVRGRDAGRRVTQDALDTPAARAKADWDARIGRRTGEGGGDEPLPPPGRVRASTGRGQVTLDWAPVPEAVGYLVHRATSPDGPFEVVDHGGNDVLAVPHPPYVDTSGKRGVAHWYAVAALREVSQVGELSDAVEAASTVDGPAAVVLHVDAGRVTGPLDRPWRKMIGSST
jgi:hypothetical protein